MAGRIAYYGKIVRDGLVLDLDAAKRDSYPGSGAVWRDIAGGVITGSLINGPTFDSNNGGSIVFDGTNDYVSVPYLNINSILPGLTSLTVSTWVYLNSLHPTDGTSLISWPINNTSAITPYTVIGLGVGLDLNINTSLGNGTTRATLISNQKINTGIWLNAGFVWNGLTLNTTLNGVISSTSSSAVYTLGTSGDQANLFLGTYNTNNAYWLNGKMGSTQIYNRGLSAAEITQNYNALKGRYGL